jgi:hypothetical protein
MFRTRALFLVFFLPLAGCFESARVDELSCTKGTSCPEGYVCVVAQPGWPGKCQNASDSGGLDGVVAVDGTTRPDGQASLDAREDGSALSGDQSIPGADATSPSLEVGPQPGPDVGRDLGPDTAPDLPSGPEVGPDVPPTSCTIGGSSYTDGAINPSNICQVCKLATSSSSWSSADEGTFCAAGKYCNHGACNAGCFISGAYYANEADNPAGTCQTCQAAYASTTWTTMASCVANQAPGDAAWSSDIPDVSDGTYSCTVSRPDAQNLSSVQDCTRAVAGGYWQAVTIFANSSTYLSYVTLSVDSIYSATVVGTVTCGGAIPSKAQRACWGKTYQNASGYIQAYDHGASGNYSDSFDRAIYPVVAPPSYSPTRSIVK